MGPPSDGTEIPIEPSHTWENCMPLSKLQLKTGIVASFRITWKKEKNWNYLKIQWLK